MFPAATPPTSRLTDSAAEIAPPHRPPGGYTVLVVDDEEPVRRLACRMLTWTGYQALEATHGREAIATMEQHAGGIHLVLTDIKMLGMSGREFLRAAVAFTAELERTLDGLHLRGAGLVYTGLKNGRIDPGGCRAKTTASSNVMRFTEVWPVNVAALHGAVIGTSAEKWP